jgi:hypothetical protein
MKKPWTDAANVVYEETKVELQTVYDALNKGQQQKLLKDEAVKELFDRYGVEYTQ